MDTSSSSNYGQNKGGQVDLCDSKCIKKQTNKNWLMKEDAGVFC